MFPFFFIRRYRDLKKARIKTLCEIANKVDYINSYLHIYNVEIIDIQEIGKPGRRYSSSSLGFLQSNSVVYFDPNSNAKNVIQSFLENSLLLTSTSTMPLKCCCPSSSSVFKNTNLVSSFLHTVTCSGLERNT